VGEPMFHRFASYCLYSAVISVSPAKSPAVKVPSASPSSEQPLSTRVERHIQRQLEAKYRAKPGRKKKKKKAKSASIINRIQKFYEQTEDLHADFIQTYTRVALSRTSESRGTMIIKKPGMMRWDYREPEIKSFITDGKKLIVYEPEEEQVIIDRNFRSSQLTSSMSFLFGQGQLTDSFKIVKITKQKQKTIVRLKPKTDATYTALILTVETKSGKVLESELHETAGNTNHFKFRNIKTNTKVKVGTFDFTPPAGFDVIER
jgi:outer membrane lipoprotein carrier protein